MNGKENKKENTIYEWSTNVVDISLLDNIHKW